MMSALAIYCVASLASATAQDWHTFFAWRIVAGFGSGAETLWWRRTLPESPRWMESQSSRSSFRTAFMTPARRRRTRSARRRPQAMRMPMAS
ncbi:hypothetical protein AWB75_00990 [Caballeronia catudaia]|uniref:Major facilitator transporter n=1 Tax=Caballeronia catudaia TaxID=1777136 RepID=A0A157ZPG2_9BURK|nr:hypothetical protein AWB75_00990 [Caballeronia catudaia]